MGKISIKCMKGEESDCKGCLLIFDDNTGAESYLGSIFQRAGGVLLSVCA